MDKRLVSILTEKYVVVQRFNKEKGNCFLNWRETNSILCYILGTQPKSEKMGYALNNLES